MNVNNNMFIIFFMIFFLFLQTGVQGYLEIEPPYDVEEIIGQLDEISKKQLDYLLEIPAEMETINQTDFFKPYNIKSKEKIADLLMKAAEIEPDECHKNYLTALSYGVLNDTFHTTTPEWFTLEKNKTEIIFLPNETHLQKELWIRLFFQAFGIDETQVSSQDEVFLDMMFPPLAASAAPREHKIFDTFIFLNDEQETLRFEEYIQQFEKMEANVPYKTVEKVVSFIRMMPPIKIAHLVYSSVPGRVSITYPDREVFYYQDQFKIVIFKNLIDTYVKCILKPLSEKLLAEQQLKFIDIESEAFLSNLVMQKMAHQMGPLFLVQPKYKKTGEIEYDTFNRMEDKEGQGFANKWNPSGPMKDGRMQGPESRGIWSGKQLQDQNRDKDAMELKLISETLGDTFLIIEELKANVLAIHNTSVLIGEGLIPREDEINIYAAYVISLVDKYRKEPNNPLNPAYAIQLNHLIKKGALNFNINTQKLSIDLSQFSSAIETLASLVILRYQAPFQLLRGGGRTPEVQALLNNTAEIPMSAFLNINVKTE